MIKSKRPSKFVSEFKYLFFVVPYHIVSLDIDFYQRKQIPWLVGRTRRLGIGGRKCGVMQILLCFLLFLVRRMGTLVKPCA